MEEGLVGEPLVLTAQKSYKLGMRHPMYTRRATYGGTIPWVAIHAIDWLWWFTGGGLVEVTAAHTTTGNRDHAELESSGACFYRLANGGSASVSFDYFRPAAAPGHGDDRLRVAGERGVVEVMNGEAVLATHDAAPRKLEREEPRAMFLEFVRHIETGSPMRVIAEEAFAVSEVALKSREAADRSASVRLRRPPRQSHASVPFSHRIQAPSSTSTGGSSQRPHRDRCRPNSGLRTVNHARPSQSPVMARKTPARPAARAGVEEAKSGA